MKKALILIVTVIYLIFSLNAVSLAEETNISLGKPYRITTGNEGSQHNKRKASFTDGVKADDATDLSQFYAFFRYEDDWWDEENNAPGQWGPQADLIPPNTENINRQAYLNNTYYDCVGEVVIDLQSFFTVSSISFEYTTYANMTVDYIVFSSENGEEWTQQAVFNASETTATEDDSQIVSESFEKIIEDVRFIKIAACGGPWMFLGEIEVFGTDEPLTESQNAEPTSDISNVYQEESDIDFHITLAIVSFIAVVIVVVAVSAAIIKKNRRQTKE